MEALLTGPLLHRALTSRDERSDFRDPVAEQLVEQLGPEEVLRLADLSAPAMLTSRLLAFDRVIDQLIADIPDLQLVNVGAGLCTRKCRVRPSSVPWTDLDSAKVIDLRRRLLLDVAPRSRYLVGEVQDDTWMRFLWWRP